MKLYTFCKSYLGSCLIEPYQWLYFSPFRCIHPLRIDKYLSYQKNMGDTCRLYFFNRKNICFVYHEIAKSGCSTIKSMMLDIPGQPLPDQDRCPLGGNITPKTPGDVAHLLYYKRPYKTNSNLPQELSRLDKVFNFTFVRNPWARLVSCYLDKVCRRGGLHPTSLKLYRFPYPGVRFKHMSFSDFAKFVCRVPDDLCDPHFRPQSISFDAEIVDFIGRLEHFREDLAQIINRIGLDERMLKWADVKINQFSVEGHYTDFYNAKTQSLVAKKYASDIEQFGYQFGD